MIYHNLIKILANADWEPEVIGDSCVRIWYPDFVQEGQWHHIVLVLNRAVLKNSSFSLYMDGQHVHTQKVIFFNFIKKIYINFFLNIISATLYISKSRWWCSKLNNCIFCLRIHRNSSNLEKIFKTDMETRAMLFIRRGIKSSCYKNFVSAWSSLFWKSTST